MATVFPLPFSLILDSTEVAPRVTSLAVVESVYRPLSIRAVVRGERSDPDFLDAPAVLTLFDPNNLSSLARGIIDQMRTMQGAQKHFVSLGETAYHGRIFKAEQSFVRTSSGKLQSSWHLWIESPLYGLRNGGDFRIFSNKKLKDAFEDVLEVHQSLFQGPKEVKRELDGLPDAKREYLVQYEENDLDFLLRLCEEFGVGFTQIGPELKFLKGEELIKGKQKPLDYQYLSSWSSLQANLSRKLAMRNLKSGEVLEKVAESGKAVKGPKESQEAPFRIENFLDEQAGEGFAENQVEIWSQRLSHRQSGFAISSGLDVGSSLISPPIIGLRAGDIVPGPPKWAAETAMQSFAADAKLHLVEEVTWHYSVQYANNQSTYQDYGMEATLRSAELPYAPPRLHPAPLVEGYLRAQVISPRFHKKTDDEKLGRIKVLFLWDPMDESSRSNQTCWVRLLTPYMGKKHGLYVMPEVGDEVLIGFEGGNVNRPVALGSVPQKNSEFIRSLTGDAALQMETLAFTSPKGLDIRAWEKEGDGKPKQKLTVDLPEEIRLVFSAEDKTDARLTSNGTVGIIAKDAITIQSEEKIELLCGKSKLVMLKDGTITVEGVAIKVSGDTIALQAQKEINAESLQKACLRGNQSVEVESLTQVAVKSNAKVEVAAGAMAEIKGAVVKIN